jgi:fructokinase
MAGAGPPKQLNQIHYRPCPDSDFFTNFVLRQAGAANAAEFQLGLSEREAWRALAHVINVVDPDVILLGGGLSNLDRLCENVPRLWSRLVFSDRMDTRLARYVHGDTSSAAQLWDAP